MGFEYELSEKEQMEQHVGFLKFVRYGRIHKTDETCDHCGGNEIVYNCPVCGAPNCCPTCCDEALEEI